MNTNPEFEGLNTEEAALLACGTKKDRIVYLSNLLLERFPGVGREAYSAVGQCLKKYPFNVVVLTIKNVSNLRKGSIYAQINYCASSYYSVDKVKVNQEELKSQTERVMTLRKKTRLLEEKRRALVNPEHYLLEFLVEGRITKEQFEETAGMTPEELASFIEELVVDG